MKLYASVLILTVLICFGHAKVILKKGETVNVTFEGDNLEIRLDNPQRQKGEFELCFRSNSYGVSKSCPERYTSIFTAVKEKEIVYKLNREGELMWSTHRTKLELVFEVDGSLQIMLASLPSTAIVYLPNAELPVVTTTTLTSTMKAKDNKAVIRIVVIAVLILLVIFVIGAVLLYCCWYKKRRHQPIPANAPDEDARQTCQESEEPLQKVIIERPALRPKPTRSTPLPLAVATTTRLPSTSTTKTSNEKPLALPFVRNRHRRLLSHDRRKSVIAFQSFLHLPMANARRLYREAHTYGQNRV